MTSGSTYSKDEQPANPKPMIKQDVPITTGEPQLEPISPSEYYRGQLSANQAIHLHGHAPAGDQVRVFLSQTALGQIDDHAQSNTDYEVGGVLMGHFREGEAHLSIDVLAALPAVTADQGPVHFTFTADAWAKIHQDRSDQFPDLQIVGWFHTHPDLGVFYSADDVVVHSAAFVMPWQVGLVLDPIRLEGCLFGWRSVPNVADKPDLIPINGFYELLDERPVSELSWKFVRSTIWQDSYIGQEGDYSPNDFYLPDNDWPALPQISPWWGVLLGGTSLIISLLLLLERILSSAGN